MTRQHYHRLYGFMRMICLYQIAPFLLIFTYPTATKKENNSHFTNLTNMTPLTYLALGDSYTIGESVLLTESFPYQVVQQLRQKGIEIHAPEIIAKTGWTTDELQKAISSHSFLPAYDFVSLLVGVNNQYRSYPISQYEKEFEQLLKQAILFAGGNTNHVIVLSIPDWGVTPFAAGRDREQIANEIDNYNVINRQKAAQYQVHYIDITAGTREAATDKSLLTTDDLHPSAKDYCRWAEKIATSILNRY